MKKINGFSKYETPEIEITRFELESNLMDEITTHPNEGPGEIITYESESMTHENGDLPWPPQF